MRARLLIGLLFFCLCNLSAQIKLTPAEKQFLKDHPIIKVANEDDWPPFDFSVKGKASGLTISYVDLIAKKLGIKVEYINGHTWDELLTMSKKYELDVMPCIWYSEEREEFLKFTKPYANNPQVIVTGKKNMSIKDLADLEGKKVAFVKDYAVKDKVLEQFPGIEVVEVKSPLEGLLLVNLGNADAYIDSLGLVSYQIEHNLLSGLRIAGKLEMKGVETVNNLYMGVRKDWPLLHSVWQKALDSLTEDEIFQIQNRWLMEIQTDEGRSFEVMQAEKTLLESIGKVRLGVTDQIAPIEYVGIDGGHKGISGEYLNDFLARTNIRSEETRFQNISEGINALIRKDVDVISTSADVQSPELVFTQPYLSLPVVVVTRSDTALISNLNVLSDKKVAFVKGFGLETKLAKQVKIPDAAFYSTINDALKALKNGEVYAYCGDLASSTYFLKTRGKGKFAIAHTTDLNLDMCFAFHNSRSDLAAILDRYLSSINEDKRMEVNHRWMNIFVEEGIQWRDYWKEMLFFGVVIFGAFGAFAFWNRKLSNEIEERLKVEKSLVEAREKAEESDKAKGEFLAMMSHEIRTPLNGIIGMSQLLEDSNLSQEQKNQCEIIVNSGKGLLGIINDILDFSKIEAGKMTMEKHPFDFKSLLNEVSTLFKEKAREQGLELNLELISEFSSSYIGDQVRIRQVLLNLLGNAFKFTHEGSVTIIAESLSIKNRDHVRISVKDTGIGISEEAQQQLFHRFTQADTTTTRKYGGTGLGLAITKRIVELMGGKITLKSEEGKGSCFTAEFPLKRGLHTLPVEDKSMSSEEKVNLKILLVEDNIVNQKIAVKMLQKFGCEVEIADNGRIALETIDSIQPNLILMDCHMPELDGYETTREIRKLNKYDEVPIVAMTANALEGDREKCLSCGMNDYMTKPFNRETLKNIIISHSKGSLSA